jgi:hypothetical protein
MPLSPAKFQEGEIHKGSWRSEDIIGSCGFVNSLSSLAWLAKTCLDVTTDGYDVNVDIKQFCRSHCIRCRLMSLESGCIADFLLLKKLYGRQRPSWKGKITL